MCAEGSRGEKEICIGWTKCNISQPQNVTQYCPEKKKEKFGANTKICERKEKTDRVYLCVAQW